MRRYRVVDERLDPSLRKVVGKGFTPPYADNEDVPYRRGPLRVAGQDDISFLELLEVDVRLTPPVVVPGIEVSQFDEEQSRLQLVKPAVDAEDFVLVFLRRAVVAQQTDPLGDCLVVRRDGPAISECAQVLAGVEAKGTGVTQGTRALLSVFRAMRLRGVLEQDQAVGFA